VRNFVEQLQQPSNQLVTFLTGAAVARIFSIAERHLLATPLVEGLARATVVGRGPKPVGALTRRGLLHVIGVASPYTTADVIAALEQLPVAGRDVTVVHYGERNEEILLSLTARGAIVSNLVVYEWRLPDEVGPLVSAIDAIIGGDLAIVAFTSRVQLRHLLEVAGPRRATLLGALNRRVVVGAVGPTCANACYDAGIVSVVVPEQPKLAALLAALAAAARSPADKPTS
jgi:uroporphyrinogen-III synthase